MNELEMGLTLVASLAVLAMAFAMVESNQQKRKAQKAFQDAQKLLSLSNDLAGKADELRGVSESKDNILDALIKEKEEAQAKVVELTQLLNNNQEYILALEDKAIAKKASEKKAKAPAKKAAPKKSKKG